jgi:hypothetical protein
MGYEVPDSERADRIVAFLEKHGYQVSKEDIMSIWRSLSRRKTMYWLWHHRYKRCLAQVLRALRGLKIEVIDLSQPRQLSQPDLPNLSLVKQRTHLPYRRRVPSRSLAMG